MPTLDPQTLARVIRIVSERMGLGLSARATSALRFQEWVELESGGRGARIVEAPAVLVGDTIAIRVESDSYRVDNLAASPYHGLFHQGFCKTSSARNTVQVAVMAAIH